MKNPKNLKLLSLAAITIGLLLISNVPVFAIPTIHFEVNDPIYEDTPFTVDVVFSLSKKVISDIDAYLAANEDLGTKVTGYSTGAFGFDIVMDPAWTLLDVILNPNYLTLSANDPANLHIEADGEGIISPKEELILASLELMAPEQGDFNFGINNTYLGLNVSTDTQSSAFSYDIDLTQSSTLKINADPNSEDYTSANPENSVPVPEPTTLLLLGSGLFALVAGRKKKKFLS